ncbi:hypothetical protein GCM10010376_30640 [Streptomyces violaceusniger]
MKPVSLGDGGRVDHGSGPLIRPGRTRIGTAPAFGTGPHEGRDRRRTLWRFCRLCYVI